MTGKLHILPAREGDRTVEWDTEIDATLKQASAEFERMLGVGYMASRVDAPGQAEQIREFDPEAKTIVMTRPLQGG